MKFTVWAKNESGVPVTNVIVKDEFPSTGATITGTTTTMGTTFNSMTGQWTIPTLAAMDSVKLEITATVIERGVFFNKAEVMSMGTTQQQFEDEDSTPNNKMLGEDDYATACFSVPLLWYPGDEYTVTPDAMGYSNVEWIKVGTGAITGIPADSAMVKGDTLVITGTGRFAFTAKVNTTCPATGCCDIIVVPAPLGSIGDFVWKDVNDNGRQDAGEQGVNGIQVILWSATGSGVPIARLDTTVTATVSGQAGKYSFDGLAAGNYVVQFVSSTFPAGCLLTPKQNQAGVPDSLDSDANPTTGVSQLVVLDPSKGGLDKNNPTIDAGLFSPLGSIGDFVWKDADNDGIQDATEQGVNGVKMVLYQKNQAGTFVAVDTVTTANSPIDSKPGYYLFEGLLGGEYQVGILKNTLPTGCVLSDSTNKGGDDTKDSDFNPITGLSPTIVIDPTKGGISKDNPTVDGALRNLLGSI
ncbi:MAG: hypothetical protein MUE30_11330, partial [Spirosomaceae bacterium]|nr:hypothetical protein [Spirosomataceae bacterium]